MNKTGRNVLAELAFLPPLETELIDVEERLRLVSLVYPLVVLIGLFLAIASVLAVGLGVAFGLLGTLIGLLLPVPFFVLLSLIPLWRRRTASRHPSRKQPR